MVEAKDKTVELICLTCCNRHEGWCSRYPFLVRDCPRFWEMEKAFRAGIREVVEFINYLGLCIVEPPKEGKGYTFLGSYILKWGEETIPSYGFLPVDDCAEWQAKLREWGLS